MANELKVKNGLIIEGQTFGNGFTASVVAATVGFFGTASWAAKTVSASFSDFATTASFALNFNPNATASYALTSSVSVSSSFATSAYTASYLTPGTYQITSSWSNNSLSANVATSASWASASIFSNVAISASWASASISSSYAYTSSFLNGFNFDNTSSVLPQTSSLFLVAQRETASYLAAFCDYAANSGSNIRAGTIFGAWINNTASYAEYTTVDVGDTSQVTMSLRVTQSMFQLLSTVSTTSPWTIRTTIRYI